VARAQLLAAILALSATAGHAIPDADDLAARYRAEVDMRLEVPADAQARYAERLKTALAGEGLAVRGKEHLVVVDRSPYVQAAFIFWLSGEGRWGYVGASPVSTGRRGSVDHFVTPTGVFEHTPANMDFRAEGTRNDLGILGYGRAGMRVYDFGWTLGERGWGAGGKSIMRLQMHATDPDALESRLGRVHSKGCIRIPATLNDFIDRYGILDAEYEWLAAGGRSLWVLRPDRLTTAWPGRYLVVVDSRARARPSWSPLPAVRERIPVRAASKGEPGTVAGARSSHC
jgi:hypothetical protein